jgi:hypothetical protein
VRTETFPTSLPPTHRVPVEEVQHAVSDARRVVFLGDDPTRTQTVGFAGNVGDDDALADVVDRLEPK